MRAFATKNKKRTVVPAFILSYLLFLLLFLPFSFLFEACSDSEVGFNSRMSVCMSMLCACLILNPVGDIGSRIARSLCT